MPSIWPVNLTPTDKELVTQLAQRRQALGLVPSFAETIRAAVALAMTASDEDLKAGTL
jgi:hypothetical protein